MNGLNRLDQPTINGLQSLELDSITANTISSDLMHITNIEGDTITIDNKLIMMSGSSILAAGLEIQGSEVACLNNCETNIHARFGTNETDIDNLQLTVSGTGGHEERLDTAETDIDNLETAISGVGGISSRLDYAETDIDTLQDNMSNVLPLINQCQNITADYALTTFTGGIEVDSVKYLGDGTTQSTAFTSTNASQLSSHVTKTQLLTSTALVSDIAGNLSANNLITRGNIAFPNGSLQTTAFVTNTRVSMSYVYVNNYIWGLGSPLNYNSLYATSNIFLSSNISNNACITGGKFHKPGRYMITFSAQITDLKWFTTLISRIMITNEPSTTNRYTSISAGRSLGTGHELTGEDHIFYSVQAVFDVTTALDTSFGIYNEIRFASSVSGDRTVLKGEILVYEL